MPTRVSRLPKRFLPKTSMNWKWCGNGTAQASAVVQGVRRLLMSTVSCLLFLAHGAMWSQSIQRVERLFGRIACPTRGAGNIPCAPRMVKALAIRALMAKAWFISRPPDFSSLLLMPRPARHLRALVGKYPSTASPRTVWSTCSPIWGISMTPMRAFRSRQATSLRLRRRLS